VRGPDPVVSKALHYLEEISSGRDVITIMLDAADICSHELLAIVVDARLRHDSYRRIALCVFGSLTILGRSRSH